MLYSLFMFAVLLSQRGTLHASKAASVALHARDVAIDMRPFFRGSDGRERTAKLLVRMVAGESAGDELAIGDHGEAHGAMQVHPDVWGDFLETRGFSYADYFDMEQAMRMGLTVLYQLRTACGTPRRALYAFASGSCQGTPLARQKMDQRCLDIGGCD